MSVMCPLCSSSSSPCRACLGCISRIPGYTALQLHFLDMSKQTIPPNNGGALSASGSKKDRVTKEEFKVPDQIRFNMKTDLEQVLASLKSSRDRWGSSAGSVTYRRAALMYDAVTRCYGLLVEGEYSKAMAEYLNIEPNDLRICFYDGPHDKLLMIVLFKGVFDSLLQCLHFEEVEEVLRDKMHAMLEQRNKEYDAEVRSLKKEENSEAVKSMFG